MAQKLVTITSSQTIFDLALQYGYIDNIYSLIQLNIEKIPNIIFGDLAGLQILVEDTGTYITDFFNKQNVVIATKTISEVVDGDIGYRITEEGDTRILENLDTRILE